MKNKTPRGKTPSLISGKNGCPKKVTVLKASSVTDCARCDHRFETGNECVQIPQMGKAYSAHIRVCQNCFSLILAETQKDLDLLKEWFSEGS